MLVLDGATLQVAHGGGVVSVDVPAVVIVPPGSSSVRITSAGTVIRVIAAATAADLAGRCANQSEYEADDANVAEFAPWPGPPLVDRRVRTAPTRFRRTLWLGAECRRLSHAVNYWPDDVARTAPEPHCGSRVHC